MLIESRGTAGNFDQSIDISYTISIGILVIYNFNNLG